MDRRACTEAAGSAHSHLASTLFKLQLGLDGLAEAKLDAGLVGALVAAQSHPELVPNAEQQQTLLDATNSDLPNELVYVVVSLAPIGGRHGG